MDVVALGELLVDFTSAGISGQGNQIYEANPEERHAMYLQCFRNWGEIPHLLEK